MTTLAVLHAAAVVYPPSQRTQLPHALETKAAIESQYYLRVMGMGQLQQ